MMNTMRNRLTAVTLLTAATALGSIAPAKADLIITTSTAPRTDTFKAETVLNGGPGGPVGLAGWTSGALPNDQGSQGNASTLVAATTGTYIFTFEGAGDTGSVNTFTSSGNTFTANPPGATGTGSTPAGTSFTEFLTAGTPISFTLTSNNGCTVSNGTTSSTSGCNYLIALPNGLVNPTLSQGTAWIGFSDGGTSGDRDFQDLVVKVTEAPEPSSLALLGAGLAGLGLMRRRRKTA